MGEASPGSLVVLGSTLELPAPARCGPAGIALPGACAAPDSDADHVRGAAGSRRALDLASAGRQRGRGEPEPGCALDRAFGAALSPERRCSSAAIRCCGRAGRFVTGGSRYSSPHLTSRATSPDRRDKVPRSRKSPMH